MVRAAEVNYVLPMMISHRNLSFNDVLTRRKRDDVDARITIC